MRDNIRYVDCCLGWENSNFSDLEKLFVEKGFINVKIQSVACNTNTLSGQKWTSIVAVGTGCLYRHIKQCKIGEAVRLPRLLLMSFC